MANPIRVDHENGFAPWYFDEVFPAPLRKDGAKNLPEIRRLSLEGKNVEARARLAPTRIGKYGQMMEWLDDYDEPEPHHRHVFHLFCQRPSFQIGVTAAISAMLMQSHGGVIRLLAALPDASPEYKITSYQIRSQQPGEVKLRVKGAIKTIQSN